MRDMKDRVPAYKEGWFRKQCVTCGVKTKERIDHVFEVWAGLSEVYRYPDKDNIPQHYSCHNKICTCDESMKRDPSLVASYG